MEPRFLVSDGPTVVVRVDLGIYGLDPLLRAAHKFTGRCFVHLESQGGEAVLCRILARQPLDNAEALAGEFCNEVLDQCLRARLAAATEPVRRLLLAQAFSRANLLHPELDDADPTEDSAGIGRPDDPHA